jgi:hypothetical protein
LDDVPLLERVPPPEVEIDVKEDTKPARPAPYATINIDKEAYRRPR